MTHYHAVMLDETRCEFGVGIEANTRDEAYNKLREEYPESLCVQLEDDNDTRERIEAMENHIARGGDWDDDGRPIYGPGYEEEYFDDDDDNYDEEDDQVIA